MRDHQKKLIIYVIILAVATVMWPRLSVFADEDFTSNYNQRTFSDTDGFDSGEANCVCQSVSGYIWIGTDNGLYRYDGSEFTLFSLDGDEDATKYSINCIYLTSDEKLYVGTDNYGLYMYDNGTFQRVSEMYNLGVSTINAMYEDDNKNLWIAASSGIFRLSSDGAEALADDVVSGLSVGNISGHGDYVYAIANNDILITVDPERHVSITNKSEYRVDDINSLYVDENGNRYYGSAGYSILKIGTDGKNEIINTGNLHGINKIYSDGDNIWALADDGVGYISSKGNVTAIGGLSFNESMSDMIIDFEGNYWFTSYR